MVHYLRNKNNKTIADIEVTKDDLSAVVCIKEYSEFLLSLPHSAAQSEFIYDFDLLQEIRGVWFESCPKRMEPVDDFVAWRVKLLSDKWGLRYVTD